jgi:hypothetical protein
VEALRAVIGKATTTASAVLSEDAGRLEEFLANSLEFVKASSGILTSPYLVLLGARDRRRKVLSASTAREHMVGGRNMFHVDEGLRLLSAVVGDTSLAGCSSLTDTEKAFGLLVHGTYVHFFLQGKIIGGQDAIDPGAGEPRPCSFYRPMKELLLILRDHKSQRVDRQQGFRYWHDATRRVLRKGSNGTEHLFHYDLYWWMGQFVSDGLRVYAEPSGMGQDKTDINVVTASGNYVVEVKWLGKNEAGMEYGQARIAEGIAQIGIYLKNDGSLVCGDLVVYDGRERGEHENQSTYDAGKLHSRCRPPVIIFLEGEQPSVAARRIASEAARKGSS